MVLQWTPRAKNVLVENRFQQSLAMYFDYYFFFKFLGRSFQASKSATYNFI